jgi:hypothetical protein
VVRSIGAAKPVPVTGPGEAPTPGTGTTVAGVRPGWPPRAVPAVAVPAVAVPASAGAEPSWGRVLATTIGLWVSRRLARFSRQRRRDVRWQAGIRPRRPAGQLRRRSAGRLWLAIGVLALAATALTVFRFAAASSPPARASSPGRPHSAGPAQDAAARAAAAVRSQAAAWIAGQVSSDETIACDPLMCAALREHGVVAGRLLLLTRGTAGPLAAGLIAASASTLAQLGGTLSDEAAPALIASFGSGDTLIDVRAAAPGGAAGYASALRADLAARRAAGAQLLRSGRLQASPQGAAQLRAGEVDARVLVMLAELASLQPVRVIAFGDASPGAQVPSAQVPLRQVTISMGEGPGLAAAVAMVRAQRAVYQPAAITTVDLASGQAGLDIEFAAPSPLGLLAGGAAG